MRTNSAKQIRAAAMRHGRTCNVGVHRSVDEFDEFVAALTTLNRELPRMMQEVADGMDRFTVVIQKLLKPRLEQG